MAIVELSSPSPYTFAEPPSGEEFVKIPELCAYWPLSVAIREGQQSDRLTKWFLNVVPFAAKSELSLD